MSGEMSAQEIPNAAQEQRETQESLNPGSGSSSSPGPSTPSNGKSGEDSNLPAEICVVLGGSRNTQALGSYTCGICGKKYKYYNCFQTHIRAHRESDNGCKEGGSQGPSNNNFRYTCDICGKKYKYYSCFQEHRDLHAVDDPYEQVAPIDDSKEEEPVETFQKIGPKTGNYVCDFCGKQYKYFNPFQEHVALHGAIRPACEVQSPRQRHTTLDIHRHEASTSEHSRAGRRQKPSGRAAGPSWEIPLTFGSLNSKLSGSSSALQKAGSCMLEPYTCGSCGIQFQFYNNLLEHMQSHAADNENHSKVEPDKKRLSSTPVSLTTERNQSTHGDYPSVSSVLQEKERQEVAEQLLKVMCADPGALNILNGKDFIKLGQILVDMGARHGPILLQENLGDLNSLALKQLPCMYNQVKVRVTCALGSSSSPGIAVTFHSQTVGSDTCCVLTAYQVEGVRLKRYVLGVRDVDGREGAGQVQHWVQNVLSEFVMCDVRTVYVTEPGMPAAPLCGRAGVCLRCAGCALDSVVQAVLSKKNLKARGLHEVADLLATCRDLVGVAGLTRDVLGRQPPPCWDPTVESLLLVHERLEEIHEAYGRSRRTAPLVQGLDAHLLAVLASLLAPLRQAAAELSCERRPTLQLVLPLYLRLEKLFTSKTGDGGASSKLSHYFLEALKGNFKVERAHQVAMVLDPLQKLRPVPTFQHEEIIGKACEMAAEVMQAGERSHMSPEDRNEDEDEDVDGPTEEKRLRLEASGKVWVCGKDKQQTRQELLQYLAEPPAHDICDLFQYWRATSERNPKLARLALWLLSVPAVGVRSECIAVREQAFAMKRRRQVKPEEMNKLIFLKSNMT